MKVLPSSMSLVVQQSSPEEEVGQRTQRTTNIADKSSDLLNRILAGFLVIAVLIGGLGGWGATAELSGAVIAQGSLVVDGSVKKIQHPTGGIVSNIAVRNGDRVAAGDVLLTLDMTQPGAQLAIIDSKLLRLKSERARLEAERDGSQTVAVPADFEHGDAKAASAITNEQSYLRSRIAGWQSQRDRLRERIAQARKEIEAIEAQQEAKKREIELIRKELAMVTDLHNRRLANVVRLIGMQREVARFEGEHGALVAQTARVESHAKEIELQIVELDQRLLTEARSEIRLVEGQIAELEERKMAAADQVRRTVIRAPVSGVVHSLEINTEGGVLRAGELAMTIVPDMDVPSIEVRIAPSDIDQVGIGQHARLRFTALNQRLTPELQGRVAQVGADLTIDPNTGRGFYLSRIDLDSDELAKLGDVKLLPGMPIEGFISTSKRTALSYMLKPLRDQLERAMRED